MAEPRSAPGEPGAQPRIGHLLSLKRSLGEDRADHTDSMGHRDPRDHRDMGVRAIKRGSVRRRVASVLERDQRQTGFWS
jgi:hypothetical protein